MRMPSSATRSLPPLSPCEAEGLAPPSLAAWQLHKVTTFIENHCVEPIRLEQLAGFAGLSQSYFSRAFKEATGVPPHR